MNKELKIAALLGLGSLCLAAGIWLILKGDGGEGVIVLSALPAAAWSYFYGGSQRCCFGRRGRRRRGCGSEDAVVF